MSPLEMARMRQREPNGIHSCLDCIKCVFENKWYYCEDSGKLLHPTMLVRYSDLNCKRAIPKEKTHVDR